MLAASDKIVFDEASADSGRCTLAFCCDLTMGCIVCIHHAESCMYHR